MKNKLLGIDSRSQLEIAIDNGLTIGNNCHIMDEVILDPGHCWLIKIEDNVTIAPRCIILAHDASTKRDLGYTVIGHVNIGEGSFIGAGSIVLPNVSIGKKCIIGAGSVVKKDISDGLVAVGNPAKVICTTEEYLNKRRLQMKHGPIYDSAYKIDRITGGRKKIRKMRLK